MLKPIHRTLLVIPLAFILVSGSGPAAQSQPAGWADFDAYVAKGIEDWKIPGLAVAVIKDGKVVHAKGHGVRELGKSDRVDEHTLFAIGSTTKAMTAALIGMLVDEKKVAWDDPVTKHLPQFQLKDPAVTRDLTIRDLLTHRAGLGNADFLWYGQDNTIDEILRRTRLLEPAYSLRSGFIYQNIMYAAAGEVIAQVTGKPWTEVVRTRIFQPLGMRETYATLGQVPAGANVASPHAIVGDRVKVIENMSVDSVAAAGSVWSSVHDMAKWLQFLLDGGRVGGPSGKPLLSPAVVAELFRPQAFAPMSQYPTSELVKPHWMTYGLGWFQQDYRGRAVDFHTGSIDGMIAIAGLIRDEKLGIVVLANLSGGELRHALMYTVWDRYSGKPDRDWSADLLKLYGDVRARSAQQRARVESQRVKGTSPTHPLDAYTGTFVDPLRGEIVITMEGGALKLRYGSALVGALEHWHYNTFRGNWTADWRGPGMVNFILAAPTGRPDVIEFQGGRFVRPASKGQ